MSQTTRELTPTHVYKSLVRAFDVLGSRHKTCRLLSTHQVFLPPPSPEHLAHTTNAIISASHHQEIEQRCRRRERDGAASVSVDVHELPTRSCDGNECAACVWAQIHAPGGHTTGQVFKTGTDVCWIVLQRKPIRCAGIHKQPHTTQRCL